MVESWVSITGSRYYPFTAEQWKTMSVPDRLEAIEKGVALIKANIDRIPEGWGIIVGKSKGPDAWAKAYAEEKGIEVVEYEDSRLIPKHADSGCLIFWDGESASTNDFIRRAFALRREMFIVGPTGTPWAIYDDAWWEANDPQGEPPQMDIPKGG